MLDVRCPGYCIVNTCWTAMTALSTVGVCQQFTLADSLSSREIHDASWSLCLAAELIDWHPWYLCSECTGLITVRLRWLFNCSLVQGVEFGARRHLYSVHQYTEMVWPIMRNCKLLNLFLRLCLSISVDTGWTAQAQVSVNCRRQWPLSTLQLRPWLKTDSIIWHRWCLQWRA